MRLLWTFTCLGCLNLIGGCSQPTAEPKSVSSPATAEMDVGAARASDETPIEGAANSIGADTGEESDAATVPVVAQAATPLATGRDDAGAESEAPAKVKVVRTIVTSLERREMSSPTRRRT